MIFFGHLGIGKTLANPFARQLPARWLLLGTIFPDLIDKPLYYGLMFWSGKSGAELGIICGTRTFGHTALLLLLIGVISLFRRSAIAAALAFGVATHLLLDGLTDHYVYISGIADPTFVTALLWPFVAPHHFPVIPHTDVGEHLASWKNPFLWISELIGASLLGWDFWKQRHRSEILRFFRERRLHLKRFKARREKRKTRV